MSAYRQSEGRASARRARQSSKQRRGRRTLCALGLLVTVPVVAPACGDDDDRPDVIVGITGGRAPTAGRPATGGNPASGGIGGAMTEAGAGGETAPSEGGAGGVGGVPPEMPGGAPPIGGEQGFGGEQPVPPFETPPLCPSADAWSEGTRLSVSTADDDLLQAVTPDELSLAWLAGERLVYADRGSADDDFGEPLELEDVEFLQAALSVDGLRLIGLNPTMQSFAEVTRDSRDEPFSSEPDDRDFTELNEVLSLIPVARYLGDPVIVGEGDRLLFSYFEPMPVDGTETVRETLGPPWPFGVPVGGSMLLVSEGKRRIPSGMGADLRTLFYWDEVDEEQKAAQRAEAGGVFDRFESFGDRRRAAPNEACDRLYYSAPGPDGDLDLFVATAEVEPED